MKTKVTFIVLILLALGLGAGWIYRNKQANEQHDADVTKILYHSNQWFDVSSKLTEQIAVNQKSKQDLDERQAEIAKLTNDLAQANEQLTNTQTTLAKTEGELRAAVAEMSKRDARIATLEGEKEALDKQAADMKSTIASLENQISETQRKLDESEGDRASLKRQLKQLMAEKADLERKFNDLASLRAQVKKLREEFTLARRLQWIREGVYQNSEMKGAQKLLQAGPAAPKGSSTNRYDLNVEVKSDGSLQVIPPAGGSTTPDGATPTAPTTPQ